MQGAVANFVIPRSPPSLPLFSAADLYHGYGLESRFSLCALPSRRPLSSLVSFHTPNSDVPFPGVSILTGHAAGEAGALEVQEHSEVEGLGFIEVGDVCGVHGLRGEVRVKPYTDFPELRFTKPGKRWLRARISGKERIQEVELLGGRNGHKGWILRFCGFDTVEKARLIVGSTLLVREDDRPLLEDGEFYTHDLLGMSVILKETGTVVGTVANVVNYGASDLLHVRLSMDTGSHKSINSSKVETDASGSLVWIPFVKDIVPNVDMNDRVMLITPPEGLLELNLRSDSRSKKERSQLEWKQKKKFQKRVIAAKKKLLSMGQKHALQGFSFGEKENKHMLASQIVDVNFKLLEHAIKSIKTPSRFKFSDLLKDERLWSNSVKIPKLFLTSSPSTEMNDKHSLFVEGLNTLSEGKVAVVLVVGDDKCQGHGGKPDISFLHHLLTETDFLMVDDKRILAPLVIVSPADDIQLYQDLFEQNDYFGFDIEKVRILKEASLPVVSASLVDNQHMILLRSPWELFQMPVGSGGVFNLFSSHEVIDEFTRWGIEFVQVCSLTEGISIGHPPLVGLAKSQGSDLGLKFVSELYTEHEFDIIISMKYLNAMKTELEMPELVIVQSQAEHTVLMDNEWTVVNPTEPNSIGFYSTIYSALSKCIPSNICVINVTE